MKVGPKHVKMDKQGSISSLQPKKDNWDELGASTAPATPQVERIASGDRYLMVAMERKCIARNNFGSLRKLVSLKWSSSYPKVRHSLYVVRIPSQKLSFSFFHLLQKMGLNVCVQKESKYAWEWNVFVERNSTVFASQNSRCFPLRMKSMWWATAHCWCNSLNNFSTHWELLFFLIIDVIKVIGIP